MDPRLLERQGYVIYLHNSIVVEDQTFQSWQQWKIVDLAYFVIGEIDGVKLIQRRTKILNDRNFVL